MKIKNKFTFMQMLGETKILERNFVPYYKCIIQFQVIIFAYKSVSCTERFFFFEILIHIENPCYLNIKGKDLYPH